MSAMSLVVWYIVAVDKIPLICVSFGRGFHH
jgi:hypothetical protein